MSKQHQIQIVLNIKKTAASFLTMWAFQKVQQPQARMWNSHRINIEHSAWCTNTLHELGGRILEGMWEMIIWACLTAAWPDQCTFKSLSPPLNFPVYQNVLHPKIRPTVKCVNKKNNKNKGCWNVSKLQWSDIVRKCVKMVWETDSC